MTKPGIEPATFRFIAQYLNHCATISGSKTCCREHQNKYFVVNNFVFVNCAVYEIAWKNTVGPDRPQIMWKNTVGPDRPQIMWKNTVGPDRPQITIRCVRVACWITKASNTHSDYVILTVFRLQQWLQERTSKLRYTYIAGIMTSLLVQQPSGQLKLNSMALVRERTIPTERPPSVGEVSANFCG
jgi:hypothetical protein